jgi:hypothetical protein
MVGVPAATGIGVDPPDLMRISTVCLPAVRRLEERFRHCLPLERNRRRHGDPRP